MISVKQLGYVGFGVSDRAAWADFAMSILGLQALSDSADDDIDRYRMDEYRARVFVYADEIDDVGFIGWELANNSELNDLAAQLRNAGVEVHAGSAALAQSRCVAQLMHFNDPCGLRHEIYCGAHISFDKPFQSPRAISGFVAGDQGIGHIVLSVDDLHDGLAFYRDVLGMRESDFITIQRAGAAFDIGFLHCNPRHHTVALAEVKRPKRCLHLMLQVDSLDDVGTTHALCEQNGIPIAATLGRHTNDHMVSFYMNSPSGFEIEFGWGARTVDDATWKVQTHHAPSIWGHQRN